MKNIPCQLSLVIIACAGFVACAGQVTTPPPPAVDSGPSTDWVYFSDQSTQPPVDSALPVDTAPCVAFDNAGQSCAGGQACPAGLKPVTLGAEPCSCRVACNPQSSLVCDPAGCGYRCVQLVDPNQNPLLGQGVCVLDEGKEAGEPCSPACKVGLTCVTFSAGISYCRETCTGANDCFGYKMVCVPLGEASKMACVPGGSTTGPTDGESCAGEQDYCKQGFLCDPQSKICVSPCAPESIGCIQGGTCTKLVDSATSVVIGSGCR